MIFYHFKKIIIISSLAPVLSYGGVRALTIHSRANCGNNESISWHLNTNYELKTISIHRKKDRWGEYNHIIETPWKKTWRSAAVCWGEGTNDWGVIGYHYIHENGVNRMLGRTYATSCNIYDGWWEH